MYVVLSWNTCKNEGSCNAIYLNYFTLASQSRTIREFDDRFTSKQFGYPTYKEYYEDACTHRKVSDIKVPLLCLNAADDPFSPSHGKKRNQQFDQASTPGIQLCAHRLVRKPWRTSVIEIRLSIGRWMKFISQNMEHNCV